MKYRVVTPFGTFTRSTVNSGRTYSHVVVIETPTREQIEARVRGKRRAFPLTEAELQARIEYGVRFWAATKNRQLGWSGRLDLARKLAASHKDFTTHIYDAVTGAEVA